MKQVDMKIGERLAIINAINVTKGDLQTINRVFKVLDKINPTEVEKKSLKIKFEGTNIGWDVKKDKDVSFEFTDEEFDLISEELKKKTDYTAGDRFLPSVAIKFGLGGEEKEEEKKK